MRTPLTLLLLIPLLVIALKIVSQSERQAPTGVNETIAAPTSEAAVEATDEAAVTPPSEPTYSPDDAHHELADNGDDQPIAPGLGNQNVAIEEAKLDAIKETRYNVTKCIDGYLKILPGNTTRKQAEQKVSQVCSGSFIEFISLSRHYGHPEIAQIYQDQYKSWIDREISEIYGPPQSN